MIEDPMKGLFAETPRVGTVLQDKYRILEPIGEPGGMGHVYRGENVDANVPVAIKILKPEFHNEDSLVRRFEREGQLGLSHPNIVKILFVQNRDVPSYIVMEYLKGDSLARLIAREGHLSEETAIRIFSQVLDALEFLHAQKILHRDIKPNNIMLLERGGEYSVRVIDFGIARRPVGRMGEDLTSLTRIDPRPILTPQYAPPEQFDAMSSVTTQSDLYSVAVSLYEALSGKLPYDPGNSLRLSHEEIRVTYSKAHRSGGFQKIRKRRPSLSSDWDRLFEKGLHPDPAKRFADAAQFRRELESLRPGHTRPWWPLTAGAAVILALVLLWPWFPRGPSAEQRRGLIAVRAGEVRLPSGETDFVSGFYLAPHEVTNAEYASFLTARPDVTPPLGWTGRQPPPGQGGSAVTGISFLESEIYAAWRSDGLRLPTESEFLRAASEPGGPALGGVAVWTSTPGEAPFSRVVQGSGPERRSFTTGARPSVGMRLCLSGRPPRVWERLRHLLF